MTTKISSLKSFKDIASYLGITTGYLKKLLINEKNNLYTKFSIPKKNGGQRIIHKPSKKLIPLQYKVKQLLEENFNSHSKAHGFVYNRDFITNANQHINKKYVLNVDLEDFFHSISFSRVRNMFILYYKLSNTAATTLANLCCHPNGFLPQGAPSSPIISNIIMKTLDKELTQLVKQYGFTFYTRYADDITISSNNSEFPKEIAFFNPDRSVTLSSSLTSIINKNGFKLNPSKIRLQTYKENQTVTGITVNKKSNVNRRYIKNLRAILHSFETSADDKDPLDKFSSIYNSRGKSVESLYGVFNILKGRILHVAHVRGLDDKVFQKLAENFNRVASLKSLIISINNNRGLQDTYYNNNVFAIDQGDVSCFYVNNSGDLVEGYYSQGTGFYLKNIGLVTNYHVLSDLIEEVNINKGTYSKKYYIRYCSSIKSKSTQFARILYYDKKKDIAILEPEYMEELDDGFDYSTTLNENMKIKLLGYPEHSEGNQLRFEEGNVVRRVNHYSNIRFEISPLIFGGNSGGPILNKNNQVVGIAVKGLTSNGVVPSQIIPINEVLNLFNANNPVTVI